MKVAFLSPHYPTEQQRFTRGLAEVGAQVIGVADQPKEALPADVRHHLAAYLRVRNLFDEDAAAREIAHELSKVGVDRVEALWEPLVLLAAKVRELLGIPGMTYDTVLGFRDKQLMKERVAAAGLRVPRSVRVRSDEEAWSAAERVGYPLILKPIAGAGSADTFRCDDEATLRDALARTRHVPEASVEEFVDGEEFTYDAVCIDGRPAFENVMEYIPRPLLMRTEHWVSPTQIALRDPFVPHTRPGVELGRGVLAALGMGTGFVHMEWYRKSDGEVVFGEIGCRNGGAHLVDVHNWSNDLDLYREWARAVCWGAFDAVPARAYHTGMVFKRAQGEGRIASVVGLQRALAAAGPWLVGNELLPIGAPRRNWKQTLVSDGFLAMRHPDYDTLRAMLVPAIRDLTLFAR